MSETIIPKCLACRWWRKRADTENVMCVSSPAIISGDTTSRQYLFLLLENRFCALNKQILSSSSLATSWELCSDTLHLQTQLYAHEFGCTLVQSAHSSRTEVRLTTRDTVSSCCSLFFSLGGSHETVCCRTAEENPKLSASQLPIVKCISLFMSQELQTSSPCSLRPESLCKCMTGFSSPG